MGSRGPKAKAGNRETNGRLSRRVADVHERMDVPHVGWFVYFATAGGFTKIGFSGDVRRRLVELRCHVNAHLRLMGLVRAPSAEAARLLEQEVHRDVTAQGFHFTGEWFDMDDHDVVGALRRQREAGREVLGVLDPGPVELTQPRHRFSDATGRKFVLGA